MAFSVGDYNQIIFDSEGNFSFTKTSTERKLFSIGGYKIWATSEDEAIEFLIIVKQ